MLPEWMDVTFLQRASLVAILVMVALSYFAIKMFTSMLKKGIILLVLAAVAIGAWVYRDDLDQCRKTCDCSLAGFEVEFPESAVEKCLEFKAASEASS